MEDFVDDPHLIESDDSFMRDVALFGKGAVEAIAIGAKDELFGQERLKAGVVPVSALQVFLQALHRYRCR